MNKRFSFTVKDIIFVCIFTICTSLLTAFASLPIVTPVQNSKVLFGDVLCILVAFLYSPVVGGLAAGFGTALVNLSAPSWEFCFAFLSGFSLAFVSGCVMRYMHRIPSKYRLLLAGVCGTVAYSLCDSAKVICSTVMSPGEAPWYTVASGLLISSLPTTLINCMIAAVFAALLYLLIQEMKAEDCFSIQNITRIGMLAACVFVLTKFASIQIPSPLGKTAISLGNTMCILSATLFGPMIGGLSAGLGNALVDLTDPAWAPEFYITFINKFLMAFVAGLVMRRFKLGNEKLRVSIAGICGAFTYAALYVVKNIVTGVYVKLFSWQVAVAETLTVKLPVTLINGIIAVICATLLYLTLKGPLRKAHIIK